MIHYLVDLRDEILDLGEPGVRIIDTDLGDLHVLTVLPGDGGQYDLNIAILLAALHRQDRGERLGAL